MVVGIGILPTELEADFACGMDTHVEGGLRGIAAISHKRSYIWKRCATVERFTASATSSDGGRVVSIAVHDVSNQKSFA